MDEALLVDLERRIRYAREMAKIEDISASVSVDVDMLAMLIAAARKNR